MGRGNIGAKASRLLAAIGLSLGIGAAAGLPQAVAQTFGGMGMIDLEAARDSYFNSADRDGDFALSSEEQLSAIGTSNSQLFECWDSDGDGLCSYAEFLDSGLQVFDELDANGDGHLTGDELQ
ncbi:MAG: hypothetical protein ACREEP_18305 [Dongiaceae bacterium]